MALTFGTFGMTGFVFALLAMNQVQQLSKRVAQLEVATETIE